jgi:hypothetical protein
MQITLIFNIVFKDFTCLFNAWSLQSTFKIVKNHNNVVYFYIHYKRYFFHAKQNVLSFNIIHFRATI